MDPNECWIIAMLYEGLHFQRYAGRLSMEIDGAIHALLSR